jgi:hypothetical protein
MALAGIGLAPVFPRMRGIIQLNRGDDARVWVDDEEIERQLVNAIANRLWASSALEIEDLEELDLRTCAKTIWLGKLWTSRWYNARSRSVRSWRFASSGEGLSSAPSRGLNSVAQTEGACALFRRPRSFK